MAYRSLPGRLLRYVIVQDPAGVYRTDFILCTDTSLSETEVLEAYARRWPIERTFQDCKQKLCIQNPQTQLPTAVRRSAPLGMLVYSLVVLWYIETGHESAPVLEKYADPWYQKTARPSFTEMMSTLRRLSWDEAVFDQPGADQSKQERMGEYLARVVAAA